MAKINGSTGDVFICYKDEKPTFNIVTNGDEAANGGVDDGIYEYRPLTYQDMMDSDILDQMAQQNTLSDWQKYVNTTPSNSNNTPPEPSCPPAPPPSTSPAPAPSTPPEPEPSTPPVPQPSTPPAPAPSTSPAPAPSTPPAPAPSTPPEPEPSTPPVPQPSTSPAPAPSAPPATANIDPKNVTAKDITTQYPPTGHGSNATTPFTHLINDVKAKAGLEGSGQLYVKKSDVRMAADMETDPNKKAIFEWLYENFDSIDYAKHGGWNHQGTQNFEDGLIGAGDVEKYFGLTK